MSAYLCSPATFNFLASYATRHRGPGGSSLTIFRPASGGRGWDEWAAFYEAIMGTPADEQEWYMNAARSNSILPIARALYEENLRSVKYRYEERAGMEGVGAPPVPTFRSVMFPYSGVALHRRALGAIGGLSYQACECPDFKDSLAAKILEALEQDAISELSEGWTMDEDELHGSRAA